MACLDIQQTVSEAVIDPVTSIPGSINYEGDVAVMTAGNIDTTTRRFVAVMDIEKTNTGKGTGVIATGRTAQTVGFILPELFLLVIDRIRLYTQAPSQFGEAVRYKRLLDEFRRGLETEYTVYSNTLHLLVSRTGLRTKFDTAEITTAVLFCLPKLSRQRFIDGCRILHEVLEELERRFPKYEGGVGLNSILAKLCH